MKIPFLIGLAITALAFVLTGCWDQEEIEMRATVVGLAIDKATKDELKSDDVTHPEYQEPIEDSMFKLTAQLAVPGQVELGPTQGGSSSEDNVWIVEGYGFTVGDALQSMQQKIAHDIFFGHLQVVIVSETIAREDMKPINDFFHRRPEIRRTIWMAIADGEAAETMSVAPKLEQIPAIYLSSTLDNAVDMGKFPEIQVGDFWIASASKGQEGILPYIEPKNDNIRISGLAYFNGDVMAGKLTPFQVILYNAITGAHPGGASLMIPIDDGYVLAKSDYRNASYQVEIADGKPKITVSVDVGAEIREKSNQSIDLGRPETISQINRNAEATVKQHSEILMIEMQEKGLDIFGFGEFVRSREPKYWDAHVKTNDRWQKLFPEIPIDITYDVTIDRIGIKAN